MTIEDSGIITNMILENFKEFNAIDYSEEDNVTVKDFSIIYNSIIGIIFAQDYIRISFKGYMVEHFVKYFSNDKLPYDNHVDNIKILLPELKKVIQSFFNHKHLEDDFAEKNFTLDKIRDRNIESILK